MIALFRPGFDLGLKSFTLPIDFYLFMRNMRITRYLGEWNKMCADVWTVCEVCKANENEKLSARRERLENQYGTLNPELWLECMDDLEADCQKPFEKTLCEKYSVESLVGSDVRVLCEAHCRVCGFHEVTTTVQTVVPDHWEDFGSGVLEFRQV